MPQAKYLDMILNISVIFFWNDGDIFIMTEIVNESRWSILRKEFYMDVLNCDPMSFDKECELTNAHFHKRDYEKKSVNKILLWYVRVASLKIRLLTLVLYITVVEWHVKSRRFSARLIRLFIRYSGRRPSYIILSSPYTCAQLRIVLVHFFVASNVARYSAFNRAVSLGNTLLWRFSFR